MANESKNLTEKLFEELYQRSEISMKSREKFALPIEYFRAKAQSETRLIEKEGFLKFFTDATEQEIDSMILRSEAPDFFTTQLIYEIVVNVLKRAIDNHMENDLQIQALRKAYFKIKQNLADEIPEVLKENPNFVTEDGFQDWLDSRANREKNEIWRDTGQGCINCLTEGSVYSNGSMWSCRVCRRSWRKRYSYGA